MFNKVFKIFSILIVLMVTPVFASAYFDDVESSVGNNISSGTLYFSLRSDQTNFSPLEESEEMVPGSKVTRDIFIKKEGSLPFKYNALSLPVENSCDMDLYNNLQLKVWYNYYDEIVGEGSEIKVLKYDGFLKDFNLRILEDPDLQIPNNTYYYNNSLYEEEEHWLYSEITLPEDVLEDLQNMSCDFDFAFTAWQDNLESPEDGGFIDRKSISNNISTKDWMPDVEILYPTGGEVWYLVPDNCPSIHSCSLWCQNHGMNANCEYDIKWLAENKIGLDSDLLIDIYFSNDSGNTWINHVAEETSNTGNYLWKLPYFPEYITVNGRIKIVAKNKDRDFLWAEDMSEDFCPPMLTLEDLINFDEEKYIIERVSNTEESVLEDENTDLDEESITITDQNDVNAKNINLDAAKEENEEDSLNEIIENDAEDEASDDDEISTAEEDIDDQDIEEEDTDVAEEDIIEEDITEEDITEEDITEEDITEEDITEEDITEEDITEEDITEEDTDLTEKEIGLTEKEIVEEAI